VKEATATVYGHTQRNLLAFGESKRLDEISPGDSDNFRVHLKTQQELAENTVRRRMGIAKQFFRAAARKKIIAENPFDGQPTLVRENPKRFYFISREEAEAVLDACPDAQWRLVFALCRYGGLRSGSAQVGGCELGEDAVHGLLLQDGASCRRWHTSNADLPGKRNWLNSIPSRLFAHGSATPPRWRRSTICK
jgi:hypothetical protein